MPGQFTLGSDTTGSSFDSAVAYVRGKIEDFRRLGNVELPALRARVTKIWLAAQSVGDGELSARAQTEFSKVTAAQAEWEQSNDRLQSILGALRSAGISLGAIPVAAWVVVATIGVASAMAAAFVFRDRARVDIAALCIEAVRKGHISADECGELLPPPPSLLPGVAGVVLAGGLVYWLATRRGT